MLERRRLNEYISTSSLGGSECVEGSNAADDISVQEEDRRACSRRKMMLISSPMQPYISVQFEIQADGLRMPI